MSRLNVFIDGSWLFKQCAPEKTLAAHTEWPEKAFGLDFAKLNKVLQAHSALSKPECDSLGELYLVTSIFTLPDNFDEWPAEYEGVTADDVNRTRNGVRAREHFVTAAIASGYSKEAVYHPRLRGWMLKRLREGTYEEKQVDPTVVALLVRSAITQPEDFHVVITGDADMLPAIKVAYPRYSENVFIATTHPDELKAEHRQTSFSYTNLDFKIPPLYLQDDVAGIMRGEHVYTCAHCHKAFARQRPIPVKARACCKPCDDSRT